MSFITRNTLPFSKISVTPWHFSTHSIRQHWPTCWLAALMLLMTSQRRGLPQLYQSCKVPVTVQHFHSNCPQYHAAWQHAFSPSFSQGHIPFLSDLLSGSQLFIWIFCHVQYQALCSSDFVSPPLVGQII